MIINSGQIDSNQADWIIGSGCERCVCVRGGGGMGGREGRRADSSETKKNGRTECHLLEERRRQRWRSWGWWRVRPATWPPCRPGRRFRYRGCFRRPTPSGQPRRGRGPAGTCSDRATRGPSTCAGPAGPPPTWTQQTRNSWLCWMVIRMSETLSCRLACSAISWSHRAWPWPLHWKPA